MSTLYELKYELMALQEMAEDPDVDEQTLMDTMEAIDLEFEDKLEGYGEVIRNLQAEADGYAQEIERMTRKKQSLENKITAMKQKVEEAMIATGKTKVKTRLFNFTICKNPPSASIPDEKKVPAEFMIQHEPTVNKKAVIAYLKDFGDTDWAQLTQGESLRIR